MPELDALGALRFLASLSMDFFGSIAPYTFQEPLDGVLRATQPGWLGVNLFFVLSGFLITGILVDSKNTTRLLQAVLWPKRTPNPAAYYLLLLVWDPRAGVYRILSVLSFIYLANITNLFGVRKTIGPLWSLAVEEHYYFLAHTVVRKVSIRVLSIIAALHLHIRTGARAISFERG